ncbi:hypothetical protein IBX73_10255 [candidate division WOR-3 bacterium]|nr:hypothetical protein [candidate division WOR-3 bacterium]
MKEEQFGYLGKRDKAVLFDAIALECHAFLTMDKKLWKNRNHLQSKLKIEILQPFAYMGDVKTICSIMDVAGISVVQTVAVLLRSIVVHHITGDCPVCFAALAH